MEYRNLGSSDIAVSVLTLGAWQLGDPEYWGAVERAQAEATVDAAIEAGVNFFDTAEWYGAGQSEEVLGSILAARRGDVRIASKVSPQNCTREGVRRSCEASLRRLKTDYIDLYQVHWPNPDVPFADTYGAMRELRSEGKIRAIGVSNFGPNHLKDWLETGDCVSDQVGYNALFRAPEFELLPYCRTKGIGVLAYMPLLQGILSGRWKKVDDIPQKRRRTRHFCSTREGTMHHEDGEEGLLFRTLTRLDDLAEREGRPVADLVVAWLVSQPGVTSVIVGAGKPDQLRNNAAAVETRLDDEVRDEISRITEPMKVRLGPNLDMWKSGEEARIR